jgi:hypothetical protein
MAASQLAAALTHSLTGTRAECYVDGPWLAAVPGARSGAALACARLAARSGAPQSSVDAAAPTACERPGDLLAEMAAAQLTGAPMDALLAAVDRQLANDIDHASSLRVLQRAQLALGAFQIGRAERHYAAAGGLAQTLIERHERTGAWFADTLAADRFQLSAVVGVGAVARLFAGLHAPDVVPPLTLLG